MDKPIIFSAPMVRALLTGRKTQTRRLAWRDDPDPQAEAWPSPWQRAKPGDRLWVREAASWPAAWGRDGVALGHVFYPASANTPGRSPWLRAPEAGHGLVKPSIHMPRWASRITLTVTEVRVQRLQEISEEDACAEGAPHLADSGATPWADGFADLWDTLHKPPHRWADNPEVVALTFTVVQRNIDA